jgi:hypothetical protein
MEGSLKIQYGMFRIHEMLKAGFMEDTRNSVEVAGYAIFDLCHERVGRIYRDFPAVVAEAERLSRIQCGRQHVM